MYDIFPKSLKEFIEDSTIRLPRFQRKASWDYKKRFELALSIFKNYPLGASILSKEIVDGNLTEWLLDGRQRRDSLKIIYWNPEELYFWAKKYLPIKKNQNIDTISSTFKDKVVMQRLITADDNLINKFVNSHKLIEISCFGANKYN